MKIILNFKNKESLLNVLNHYLKAVKDCADNNLIFHYSKDILNCFVFNKYSFIKYIFDNSVTYNTQDFHFNWNYKDVKQIIKIINQFTNKTKINLSIDIEKELIIINNQEIGFKMKDTEYVYYHINSYFNTAYNCLNTNFDTIYKYNHSIIDYNAFYTFIKSINNSNSLKIKNDRLINTQNNQEFILFENINLSIENNFFNIKKFKKTLNKPYSKNTFTRLYKITLQNIERMLIETKFKASDILSTQIIFL